MLRRSARLLLWPLVVTACLVAGTAQTPATLQRAQTGVEDVTLGRASAPLVGPWSFHPGDSPVLAGTPLWSLPQFDDSSWRKLDMDPPADGGDLPGWTQRGYPFLVGGYGWYRMSVHITDKQGPLGFKMPDSFDDAYQLYANGKLVGSAGFNGNQPKAYYSRSRSFDLPSPDRSGRIALALRFWLDPNTRFDNPSAGGLHGPPLLGLAGTIHTLQARDDTGTILNHVAMEGFLPLFFLLAAMASFWAWLKVRQEQAYLWLSVRLMLNIVSAIGFDLAMAGRLSQNAVTVLQDVVLRSVMIPCWIVFWWQWFRLTKESWILRFTVLFMCMDFLSALAARATTHGVIPMHWAAWLSPANTVVKFGELALLAVIFVKGYRLDHFEAMLALFPLAINEIDIFNGFSIEGKLGWDGHVLGMHIPPSAVASFVVVLTISILAVRRFLAIHARRLLTQQNIEAELLQASELQKRVLVPEKGSSNILQVETAYYPAQTVGGDFFQVLSGADGSTLIVLGDVSGKGVAAAFLVAVLVGAIRTHAERGLDPAEMLRTLNARLIDRSEGHFATCLAMYIGANGSACIANAGHLPPYLNGREIETGGALPLGLESELDCSQLRLHLQTGDRITMMSDGVVEAMDASGELFGFERTRNLSAAGAQAIALEAKQYGQEDDITVVTAQFVGNAVVSLATPE